MLCNTFDIWCIILKVSTVIGERIQMATMKNIFYLYWSRNCWYKYTWHNNDDDDNDIILYQFIYINNTFMPKNIYFATNCVHLVINGDFTIMHFGVTFM